MTARVSKRGWLVASMLLACTPVTHAADNVPAWKLTAGDYLYADYSGVDMNLRWQSGNTHAWAGAYRDRAFGTQERLGVDTAWQLTSLLQLQPSLQWATQGFIGGSVNLQAGDVWNTFVGIGRTNLRPYFNLNFDPNDALTVGVGHHPDGGAALALFLVADDRLHTQQRDWHLTARWPFAERRLTLDLLRKSGYGDSGYVHGWGLSFTVDWPSWFLRAARDPYQSFGSESATRLAAGLRF